MPLLLHINLWCVCYVKGAAKNVNTSGESRIFWLSLVVSQVFWVVFVFAALITLSFKWFVSDSSFVSHCSHNHYTTITNSNDAVDTIVQKQKLTIDYCEPQTFSFNTVLHGFCVMSASQQQQQPDTTRVSLYQKGQTNLDFTGARDSKWKCHQLDCMQICTSPQTDNHASTPPSFLQA